MPRKIVTRQVWGKGPSHEILWSKKSTQAIVQRSKSRGCGGGKRHRVGLTGENLTKKKKLGKTIVGGWENLTNRTTFQWHVLPGQRNNQRTGPGGEKNQTAKGMPKCSSGSGGGENGGNLVTENGTRRKLKLKRNLSYRPQWLKRQAKRCGGL